MKNLDSVYPKMVGKWVTNGFYEPKSMKVRSF